MVKDVGRGKAGHLQDGEAATDSCDSEGFVSACSEMSRAQITPVRKTNCTPQHVQNSSCGMKGHDVGQFFPDWLLFLTSPF